MKIHTSVLFNSSVTTCEQMDGQMHNQENRCSWVALCCESAEKKINRYGLNLYKVEVLAYDCLYIVLYVVISQQRYEALAVWSCVYCVVYPAWWTLFL